MTSLRSFATQWLGAALAVIIVVAALADAAAAIESLPSAAAIGAPTEMTRVDHAGTPVYVLPYGEQQPHRRDDTYVFAATRSLRQGGIHPVMAVVLVPATLVFDAVFLPFAVALEYLADPR